MTLVELLMRRNNGLRKGAQLKLSKAMGVTQATVSRWVSGELSPGEEQRVPLARELGISVEELASVIEATRAAYRRKEAAETVRPGDALHSATWLPVIGIATDNFFACDLKSYPDEVLPIVSCGLQKVFALRIVGKALESLAMSGDYAVLSEQTYAAESQIVLARLPEGCLLRRYFPKDKIVSFRAESQRVAEKSVALKDISILGVVKYFVRKP